MRPCDPAARVPAILLIMSTLSVGGACRREPPEPAISRPAPPSAATEALVGGPYPTLLLSKAQFTYRVDEMGRRVPVAGAAKLVLVRRMPAGWATTVLEDPDSNVLHKAMIVDLDGQGPSILTIGATQALLKVWRCEDGQWTQRTLWRAAFGGQWDRLRDVEVGDVTGDGTPDIVVATHDQGVVAVLTRQDAQWRAAELDRQTRTFVHEIEIGDVDGDGRNEFLATRSAPNQASMVSQPGQVVMYKWTGSDAGRTVIDTPDGTHAKEILLACLDGAPRPTLFAAIEARTELRGGALAVVEPVRIKQYDFDGSSVSGRVIATLNDRQCRFLSPGDVDGDGRTDIVAAAMDSGLWLLRRADDGSWTATLIDAGSSGYEHAALAADLEGDGHTDVYVASDRQHELRRYRWTDGRFDKEVILALPESEITFNLTAGRF